MITSVDILVTAIHLQLGFILLSLFFRPLRPSRLSTRLFWAGSGLLFLFLTFGSASRMISEALPLPGLGTVPIQIRPILTNIYRQAALPILAGILGAAFILYVGQRRLASNYPRFAVWAIPTFMAGVVVVSITLAARPQAVPLTQDAVIVVDSDSVEAAGPQAPAGFQVEIIAEITSPTGLVPLGDDAMLVTSYTDGLWKINLGETPRPELLDADLAWARGIAAWDSEVYVSHSPPIETVEEGVGFETLSRVTAYDVETGESRVVIDNLPGYGGFHGVNGLAFDPEGRLYVLVGAPHEAQIESIDDEYIVRLPDGSIAPIHPYAGTILRMQPDGTNVEIYARGFRNPFGISIAENGEVFVTDNGADWVRVPGGDELNYVIEGRDYGFPEFFGFPPPDSGTEAPMAAFRPHSVPVGIQVYENNAFPPKYSGALFIAIFGDEDSVIPPTAPNKTREWQGTKVVVAYPERRGEYVSAQVEDFITGFQRPLDVTVGPFGNLWIADFGADIIYRIRYIGE